MTTAEQINVHDCTDADTTTIDSPSPLPQHLTHIPRPLHPQSHQIRATYTPTTIRLYQAFNTPIADLILRRGVPLDAVPLYNPHRTTWLKPSFTWMAYRSGYATKDVNQLRILAFDLTITRFIDLLSAASLSSNVTGEVVVQWDPERDLGLRKIVGVRSLQMGVKGSQALRHARGEGIVGVTDVTKNFVMVKAALERGDLETAEGLRPVETVFEGHVPVDVKLRLGMMD